MSDGETSVKTISGHWRNLRFGDESGDRVV